MYVEKYHKKNKQTKKTSQVIQVRDLFVNSILRNKGQWDENELHLMVHIIAK